MDIQVLDFTKICRTCLGFDHEMKLIFSEETDENLEMENIRKMIADCTIYPVIKDDQYPNKICSKCINDVKIAYEFKSQCEKAFEMLSSVIESYQSVPKIENLNDPELVYVNNLNIKEENSGPSSNPIPNLKEDNDDAVDDETAFQTSILSSFTESTQYKCEVCTKVFSKDVHLRKHLSASHPSINNACTECNKNCASPTRLKKHIALCHADKSIEEDSEIVNVVIVKCDECSTIFQEEQALHEHVCPNEDSFDPTNVESILGLNEHKDDTPLSDSEIFNDINESYGDAIDQSNNSDDDDQKPLSELSGPNTRSGIFVKKNLTEKIDSPKNEQTQSVKKEHRCEICCKVFSRSTHLKRHSFTHSDSKPFSCSECAKGFTRADHLSLHMLHHAPVKPHVCKICSRGFVRAEHLRKHLESRHSEKAANSNPNPKTEFCSMCGKGFTTAKYLQIHMKSHADRTWNCKFCPETFNSKPELTDHTKTHTHEKPFLCSECGLRFVRNDYLVIHMRRHKGEKPYKCKFCNKGFPRATDLNVHERYHTGEKTHLCTVCGKGFQRAYNLLVHMRVHTGERPYSCPHCAKSFAQCNDLKAHIRRHTGERFKCDICNEGFIQGYHLTQHKRNVHGIDMKSHIRRVAKFTTPTEQQQQMEAIQLQKTDPESSDAFVDESDATTITVQSTINDENMTTFIKIEDTSAEQDTLDISAGEHDGAEENGVSITSVIVDGNHPMVFTQKYEPNYE